MGCQAKILPAVVELVAIDVIDFVAGFWLHECNVHESGSGVPCVAVVSAQE